MCPYFDYIDSSSDKISFLLPPWNIPYLFREYDILIHKNIDKDSFLIIKFA